MVYEPALVDMIRQMCVIICPDVPEHMFSQKQIERIEFPGYTSRIGSRAFSHSALRYMNFLARPVDIGEFAFIRTRLSYMRLPGGTSIDKYAFSECHELIAITFEGDVTMDDCAFSHCFKLTCVTFEGSAKIGASVFARTLFRELDVPGTLTLERNALNGSSITHVKCTTLVAAERCFLDTSLDTLEVTTPLDRVLEHTFANTSITVMPPLDVSIIGWSAFKCTWIVEIDVAINQIHSRAFSEMPYLKTARFGGRGPVSVGDNAFTNSYRLHTLILPARSIIYGYVFDGCSDLKTITSKNLFLCSFALNGSYIEEAWVNRNTEEFAFSQSHISTVRFSGYVVSIPRGLFYQNTMLQHIVLPDSIHTISEKAFSRSHICTIEGNGVKNIEKDAFKNASHLKRAFFPNAINIHSTAFDGTFMQ